MQRHGVDKLVFSSSATVYGEHAPAPIGEELADVGDQPLRLDQGDDRAGPARRRARPSRGGGSPCCATSTRSAPTPRARSARTPQGIPNNLMPFIAQVAVGQLREAQRLRRRLRHPGRHRRCATTSTSRTSPPVTSRRWRELGSTDARGQHLEPRHRPRHQRAGDAARVRAGRRPRAAVRGRRPPRRRHRRVVRRPLPRRGRARLDGHAHDRRHVRRHVALAASRTRTATPTPEPARRSGGSPGQRAGWRPGPGRARACSGLRRAASTGRTTAAARRTARSAAGRRGRAW